MTEKISEIPDDIASLHQLERRSRWDFVEQWRNKLSFLLGYPGGIPNIRGFTLAKILKIHGVDDYQRIDIWKPNHQLHLRYLKVDYDFEQIARTDVWLRVPAHQGYTYAYKKDYRQADLNGAHPRSSEALDMLILDDPMLPSSIRPCTPNHYTYYTIDTSQPRTFDLGVDMDSRREAERVFTPLFSSLTQEHFENHRR